MKWYQTKIGKTQIIGFIFGALLFNKIYESDKKIAPQKYLP